VAIPAGRNVVQKGVEKKLKYRSLCMEIQRMWNLKCTIIPIIIGATGIVTRSLRKNLEAVPGSLSGADHRWFKRSTRKKKLVTRDDDDDNNNNNNNIFYY